METEFFFINNNFNGVRQFSSNPIPKLNGVLFRRRDLGRWKQLNLSFFWIKSKLHSHSLQLLWKFQHQIHGNIAFKQQAKSSYLRDFHGLDHLKVWTDEFFKNCDIDKFIIFLFQDAFYGCMLKLFSFSSVKSSIVLNLKQMKELKEKWSKSVTIAR